MSRRNTLFRSVFRFPYLHSQSLVEKPRVDPIWSGYFSTFFSDDLARNYFGIKDYFLAQMSTAAMGNTADLRMTVLFVNAPAFDFVLGTCDVLDGEIPAH